MNSDHQAQPPSRSDAGCDMRQRTPGEIAEQLERDATSLAMTGQSFEKDKAFYEHVAANVREAAGWLARWDNLLDQMRREQAIKIVNVRGSAFTDAVMTVSNIRAAIASAPGMTAYGWDAACAAAMAALIARRDGIAGVQTSGLMGTDARVVRS